MEGVLGADDLAADRRAGHLQTDAVGGVLVDVLDAADVQGLRCEQDVDAERAPLAGDVVEQLRVLGVLGQHQGEFVGDHEQCRDRRQVMRPAARSYRGLVLGHRVEGAALHGAAGLFEQLLATGHLTAQRVGEPVGQRTLLGHVGDDGDDLREVPEDIGAGLALEVGVDDDEPVGRMSGQQRQQDRHQGLGFTRAGHADHQAVRAHPALGLVLEVEDQRFTGGGDPDGHPQFLVAVPRRPQTRPRRAPKRPGCRTAW